MGNSVYSHASLYPGESAESPVREEQSFLLMDGAAC